LSHGRFVCPGIEVVQSPFREFPGKDLDRPGARISRFLHGGDEPLDVELAVAAEPALAKRFVAAVYVGERRWNVRLSPGIEVKLPEENPAAAWKTLVPASEGLRRQIDTAVARLEAGFPRARA
jgi:hypothetical protein